jgi:hypothetical protein
MRPCIGRVASSRCSAIVAAAGLALSLSSRALAQTDNNWTNAVSGNWVDPSKWSLGVYPNDGTPPGSTYRAIFAAAGPAYVVTLNSNVTVSGLVLNSASLTLAHTAGTLTLNGAADFTSGTFQLNGGTIAGGTLNINGGGFSIFNNANNRLRNVTINGTMSMANAGAQLRIADGISFGAASALSVSGAANAKIVFENTQTVSGGTINFLATGTLANVDAGATLTISPTATIRGGGVTFGNKSVDGAANAIINQGLISADRAAQALQVTADTFTNTGTIEARNGGTLSIAHMSGDVGAVSIVGSGSQMFLDGAYTNSQTISVPQGATLMLNGSWTNTGTINAASGSTVNLGGTLTMGSLGTLNRSGATIRLTGTLDNTASSLTLGQSGPLTMAGGTIQGGSADLTTNSLIFASGGVFAGVAITGDINLSAPLSSVGFRAGTDLNGTVNMTGSGASTSFMETQTVAHGTYYFNDPAAVPGGLGQGIGVGAGATVTLGPAAVIHGGGGQVGNVTTPASVLVNQGLISSDRAGLTLRVQPTTFTNQGTLQAVNGGILQVYNATGGIGTAQAIGAGSSIVFSTTDSSPYSNEGTLTLSAGGSATFNGNWSNTGVINIGAGSTLNLGGTFPSSAIGTINNSGLVSFTGTVNNSSATLAINGTWGINGGTINGGTVDFGAGGTLLASGNNSSLTGGVTLSGNGTLDGPGARVTFSGGLTLTPGSQLTLTGPNASLQSNSTATVDGGTIVFGGPSGVDRRLGISGGTLTLGPGLTVRGGLGTLGGSSGGGTGAILNQGHVSADAAGRTINVAGTFTNNGVVEAVSGGTLSIPFYAGGSGTAHVDGAGSSLVLGSGGGSFILTTPTAATNGGTLTLAGNTWSNTSTITVTDSTLVLGGLFTRAGMGTINATNSTTRLVGRINNNSASLNIGASTGPWVMDGGFIDGGFVTFAQGFLSLTSNPGNTIQNASSSSRVFLNGGYLDGESFQPTNGLTVSGGANIYLNNSGSSLGAVSVTNSTLTLNGNAANAGIFSSMTLDNSTLNLQGSNRSLIIVPRISRSGSTTINVSGTAINTGLTTTFNDTTGVWNANDWRVDNGTINVVNNNLVFSNSTANLFNNVTVGSAFSMNGGRLVMSGGSVAGPVTLSNGANLTFNISAQGLPSQVTVGTGSAASIGGTIASNGHVDVSGGSSLTLGGTWSNNGIITITDSTLNLGGVFTAANLGNVIRSNATVNLTGTLDNTGSTLVLSPATGNWNLAGSSSSTAIITGGTIVTSGGARLTTAPGSNPDRLVDVAVQGDIYMSPLSNLRMEGNWSNTGSITVDNATLRLAGTFTGASVGNVTRTPGSHIVLEGTVNNTGSTLTLNSSTGSWETNNGTIVGGTVNLTQGSTLLFTGTGNFNNVTLNGDLNIGGLSITGDFTENGTISMAGGASIGTLGSSSWTGGTYAANGTTFSVIRCNNVQNTFPAPVLTLSSTTVVHGGNLEITSNSQLGAGTSMVINNGLISADIAGRTITLDPENLTNHGTLEAINGATIQTGPIHMVNDGPIHVGAGSTLILSCVTPSGSIRLNPGTTLDTAAGTVLVQGIIDNAGNTLSLGANTGTWQLRRGTIRDGVINIAPGGGLAVTTSAPDFGLLHNVTLNGSITQAHTLNIENDLALNGSITLSTNNDILRFVRSDTLPHTVTGGTFNLAPANNATVWMQLDPLTTLTLSPTTTVRGGGSSSSSNAYLGSNTNAANATTLINQGVISSDVAGKRIIIRPNFFTNQGLVEARNGADIEFYNDGTNYSSWSNATGTIRLLDGAHAYLGNTVQSSNIGNYDGVGGQTIITGTIDNTNQTWNVTPALGSWTNSGVIKGGIVNIQSGSSLTMAGTLDAVTINGDVNALGLSIRNGASVNGTIHMIQPGGIIQFNAPFTSGLTSGTVAFEGLFGSPIRLVAGTPGGTTPTEFVIGAAATIRGGIGEIFTNSFSTIINQGLISADRPGESITIYLSRFQNEGTIQAINGGSLVFIPPGPPLLGGGEFYNTGALTVALGASVDVQGLFSQTSTGALNLWLGSDTLSQLSASEVEAGGLLHVALEPGFVPVDGQAFRLLDSTDIHGLFSRVDLPPLPDGLLWSTSSLYTDGSVRVVPGPGALAILVGGLLCVGRRRRERRGV